LHRLRHRGESTAQEVTLPLAALAAVSFKRGGDCVRNLIGYISIDRRHQSRDGVNRRCTYQSVEENTKLILRILKNRCPVASYEAGRTRRR
jgi:hypothetical protein